MNLFDLHCDTITKANENKVNIDSDKLDICITDKEFDKYCQCFAIFCPDEIRGRNAFNYYCDNRDYFNKMMKDFSDKVVNIRNKDDFDETLSKRQKCAILTVEGGSALAGSIDNLYTLFDDGVKMITLTWNGENEIGCGSSDQSFHLKPFGIDVVKEMSRIGIQIDVSHLSDAGFFDVIDNTDCPIVASHSNLRKICGHRRNLTDEQFRIIVERKGLCGINFYKSFISDDDESASVDKLCEHVMEMLELGGEKIICLGSDYDGCDVVEGIEKQRLIKKLYDALLTNGISKNTVDDIFWNNAYNFFINRI